jgi:hypothetical protein
MRRSPAVVRSAAVVALISVGGLTACGGSSRGAEAFCSRLQQKHDTLITGVVDPKTAKTAVDTYHALDAVAPEAIRSEWHQLTLLVQAAADLDSSGAGTNAALVQQAYTAAPAAQTVTTYARATCGVDLAPASSGAAVTTGPTTVAPSPPTTH